MDGNLFRCYFASSKKTAQKFGLLGYYVPFESIHHGAS